MVHQTLKITFHSSIVVVLYCNLASVSVCVIVLGQALEELHQPECILSTRLDGECAGSPG